MPVMVMGDQPGTVRTGGSGDAGEASARSTVVYVVDDDEQLCASLAWLLESVHIEAWCFTDVAAFLAAYDPLRPACLVLDVRMPDVSGFQLQETLNAAGAVLPIVFVSAHGDIRMSVRALQRGAVDFLEKPYDPQHMLDVVQEALRTARSRFSVAATARDLTARIDCLTQREREILGHLIEGLPSKSIAVKLGISVKTVDVHRTRIREKTGARSITTLVRDLLQAGVTPPAS
ncbi:response regulator transcription factor [Prauserella marina]|uniref:response regulator transcription factor n=1 Tax=Prauserella marina TaxID=530584 RepID=UPI001FE97F7F|nr:response regulator [Prauserella marina]